MGKRANKIEVKCETCGKPKIITERAYNANKTKRFYCNTTCRNNDKFKQVEVICENCETVFMIHKSRYDKRKNKRFCCSRKCLSSYKNVTLTCDGCGSDFKRKEYEHKKTNGSFCSRKCYLNHIRNKVETNCINCNEIIFVRPEDLENKENCFCYRKCLHNWQHLNWQGENHPNFSQVEVKCSVCEKGKMVTKAVSERHSKFYCSDECLSIGKTGEGSSTWLGGISFGEYSPSFNKRLKKKIKKRDNFRCQLCGRKGNKKIFLVIHHKNYIKTDSDDDNLITLCSSCHGKTNHNREIWQRWFNSSSSFWFAARSQ